MKKLFIYIIAFCFLFTSCDNIPEDERTITVENVNAIRPVLLEDFTGQNCNNCPLAAALATKMQKVFNNKLIVVSIHAGPFAKRDFKTEAGNAYHEKFYSGNSNYYPAGMIDRAGFNNNVVTVSDVISNWTTYVFKRTQDRELPEFELNLLTDFNTTEKNFTVTSQIKGAETVSDIKLQIWITESHIIASQSSGDETILDYEHNHVLRDAVNGVWGEDIELEAEKTKTYTTNIYSLSDKKWIPENMHVVGFIYNAHTYEVLYVSEIPLVNN